MWGMEIDRHNPLYLPYDGISLQFLIYFIYDTSVPLISDYPPHSTIIYIEEQESLVHVGAANSC